MTIAQPEFSELDRLIWAYCNETISADDFARLEAELLESLPARRHFANYLHVLSLAERFAEHTVDTASAVLVEKSVPSQGYAALSNRWVAAVRRPIVWSIGLAALLFGVYVGVLMWGLRSGTLPSGHDTDSFVATITGSEDAQWASSTPASKRGEGAAIKKDSPLSIQSGLVELKLNGGTTLLIEGPAEWSIDGDNAAKLTRGKLIAKVPHRAIGFTLETPTAKIVDLGTEFVAETKSSRETTVQVLQGEVKLVGRQPESKAEHVAAGEARRVRSGASGRTVVETIPVDASRTSLPQLTKSPLERWRRASRDLLRDPGLVAYYDFETHALPGLPQDAETRQSLLINAREDGLHGQVTSPTRISSWTTGRWPGKRALALGPDFAVARVADDPALQLNGQGTIALWVRPDTKHWRRHSPIVTKGSLAHCSYSLWLGPDCRIRFLAVGTQREVLKCDSKLPVTLNRWHQVAVTMVPGEVRLYVDGVLSRTQKYDMEFAANDEPLHIGHPLEKDGYPLFVGVVDELSLFSRALSAEEIVQMFRAGAPD